jgi:hypothetical protein
LYKALTNTLQIPPTAQQLQILQQQQQQSQDVIDGKSKYKKSKQPKTLPPPLPNGKLKGGGGGHHHAQFLHPDVAAVLYPDIMANAAKAKDLSGAAQQAQQQERQQEQQSTKQQQQQSDKKKAGVAINAPRSKATATKVTTKSAAVSATRKSAVDEGTNRREFLKKKSAAIAPPPSVKKKIAQQKQQQLQQQLATRPPAYTPRILFVEGGGAEEAMLKRPELNEIDADVSSKPPTSVYVSQFIPPKIRVTERQPIVENKRSLYGNGAASTRSRLPAASNAARGGRDKKGTAVAPVAVGRPDSSTTESITESTQSSTFSLQAQHRFA